MSRTSQQAPPISPREPSPRRRANGEGSIYHVESEGRWRAAIAWVDDAGRRRRRTVSGKSQADVRKRLTALRRDLDRGLAPAPSTSVADHLSAWLELQRQRVRPSTWRQREQIVRLYLIPAFGRRPLHKLTPSAVEVMTSNLIERGMSARTASHARVVLRTALADAERDGLVHRNVAALARPPRVEPPELRHLDPTQLRQLLGAVAEHSLGPLITLAATTGLRQGELLGLSWDDVDFDEMRVTVRRALARDWDGWRLSEPKTPGSRRTVNLPVSASKVLIRQRHAQDAYREAAGTAWQDADGLVFTDKVGRPLRGDNVSAAFGRVQSDAGLPHIPFHGLRHSAATALLAAGVPLRVVSDQLGHSSIAITANIYAAVVPELRRDAAQAMDRILEGPSSRD